MTTTLGGKEKYAYDLISRVGSSYRLIVYYVNYSLGLFGYCKINVYS